MNPTEESPIITGPNSYALAILIAMSRNPNMHVYEGTVPASVVAKRRAKSRVAKQSRKANR